MSCKVTYAASSWSTGFTASVRVASTGHVAGASTDLRLNGTHTNGQACTVG